MQMILAIQIRSNQLRPISKRIFYVTALSRTKNRIGYSAKLLVSPIFVLAMKYRYESLSLRKCLAKFLASFAAEALRASFYKRLHLFIIYCK